MLQATESSGGEAGVFVEREKERERLGWGGKREGPVVRMRERVCLI
jgi:hypothetical protein